MSELRQVIRKNRAGVACSIPSVCSAHPEVLRASLALAKALARPILIEATSNQVNQFGGYTGMSPNDFVKLVYALANETACSPDLIHLGGDHLGPQAWKTEPAVSAMAKAEEMIAAYVKAGFTKIHLDCSEGCAGEAPQLSDAIAAQRSAKLAQIAFVNAPDPSKLLFVVGTEVPPPGGHRPADGVGILPTTPIAAKATLAIHKLAFDAVNVRLWPLVGGLVVQPGIEFSAESIDNFDLHSSDLLSEALGDYPNISFEAHSTDYQLDTVFAELAHRHFAFQKVGPALTFAYRQAIYQLSALDSWENDAGHIGEILEKVMLNEPGHWQGRYLGDAQEQRRLRHFSWADRIRYYWPHPDVSNAVDELKGRLACLRPTETQMRQFLNLDWAVPHDDSHPRNAGWYGRYIEKMIQTALRPYFTDPNPSPNKRDHTESPNID